MQRVISHPIEPWIIRDSASCPQKSPVSSSRFMASPPLPALSLKLQDFLDSAIRVSDPVEVNPQIEQRWTSHSPRFATPESDDVWRWYQWYPLVVDISMRRYTPDSNPYPIFPSEFFAQHSIFCWTKPLFWVFDPNACQHSLPTVTGRGPRGTFVACAALPALSALLGGRRQTGREPAGGPRTSPHHLMVSLRFDLPLRFIPKKMTNCWVEMASNFCVSSVKSQLFTFQWVFLSVEIREFPAFSLD